MGDILMTTPAAKALKKALPHSRITYVVEDPFKELVQGSPLFDEVAVLPRDLGHSSFLRSAWGFRKKRYDVVLDFHGGPRASLLTLISGANLKIGYDVRVPYMTSGSRAGQRKDLFTA
jgi:heptosyltransferase-1